MIDSQNIEETITASLEKIGRFVKADHAFLFLFSEDGIKVEKVFEWSLTGAYGRKGRITGISVSIVQDTKACNKKGGNTSPSCLVYPPIVQQELEYLTTRSIYSHLGLPVKVNGKTIGHLGVDGQKDKTWIDLHGGKNSS